MKRITSITAAGVLAASVGGLLAFGPTGAATPLHVHVHVTPVAARNLAEVNRADTVPWALPPAVRPSAAAADPVPVTIPQPVALPAPPPVAVVAAPAPIPAPAPPVVVAPPAPVSPPAPVTVPWCLVIWAGATVQPNPDQPGVNTDGPPNGQFASPCSDAATLATEQGGPGTTYTTQPYTPGTSVP